MMDDNYIDMLIDEIKDLRCEVKKLSNALSRLADQIDKGNRCFLVKKEFNENVITIMY